MSAPQLPHEWSHDQFLIKAQRYASKMLEQDQDSWEFGFWSALILEMLARAALSSISPTLLADGKDWNNIYYALGNQPSATKFVPRSANINEILNRLVAILPEFTPEMFNFSIRHANRRNSELHSGALPFDEFGTSEWLPSYYSTVSVLLQSLGHDIAKLFGADEAKAAETLIESLRDETAKSVQANINAHKTVWESKSKDEQEQLQKQAAMLATRKTGHRVNCPACQSTGLVHGTPIGAANTSLEDDLIIERQSMLPSQFECSACELKIAGYSRLNACGLGDNFTATSRYDVAEYFDLGEQEYHGWDEDFNEY